MKPIRYFAIISLALLTASCGQPKQKAAPEIYTVGVSPVQMADDTYKITVSGVITPVDNPSKVSFLVNGRVAMVMPREGSYVKQGDVLAEIDRTDYIQNLAKARAQADMARAAYAKAASPARVEQLTQAKIAYDRSADEYRRMKMLYDNKSLAPNDFEKFKAAYESAQQQYDMAKTGAQPEDKAQAKAALDQAVAYVKLAEKALGDTTLRAPVSGFISKRLIEPGDTASAGYPVFEIVGMDPVEVNAGIPETDVHLAKVGQTAAVSIPALPGQKFAGKIRVVNVSADPTTRTYMTRITVPNPSHAIKIGMVAEASVDTGKQIKEMTVPVSAVLRDPQGATIVYVYYPSKKRVYSRRVETGTAVGQSTVITAGLKTGEMIVTAGQEKLADGLEVRTEK